MDIAALPAHIGGGGALADRMHWVRVPFDVVQALYDEPTFRIQRNHLRRAVNAKYLTGNNNPLHVNFMASRTPDGKLHLIDGYTRITAIGMGAKHTPEQVWLGVVDVDTPGEAEKLYDAIDSKASVKRGRDAFEEGLRRARLLGKLESPAFTSGQAVSACLLAAGVRDARQAVFSCRTGIAKLDPLGIRAGRSGLPAGALAALILIANSEPPDRQAQVLEFAATLVRPEEVPAGQKKALGPALRCAEALEARREANALSGKNVGPIMELVLGYWNKQKGGGGSRVSALSRADYLNELM